MTSGGISGCPIGAFGPLTTAEIAPGLVITSPLSHVIEKLPLDQYPLEWLTPQSACGFSWTMLDVETFLSRTITVLNPKSPHGFCRIWAGAKSRGHGNLQWYGSFYTCGKTVRAHKFSAVAVLGLRPKPGQHVDHECHNTLCVSCLRVLTKQENESLIRRPQKCHLDLAKYCCITPAEVMSFSDEQFTNLTRMMEIGKQIEAGQRPPGVFYDGPRIRKH